MRILVSNDDGITHPGIAALRSAVLKFGETFVVAPSSPQSASGHGITVHGPLMVRRMQVRDEFSGISVEGRPADCVRLAVRKLLDDPPDLVVSGINDGANVGINVFYSGTVAAAAEAAMLGIPAVAFSLSMAGSNDDYLQAADLCQLVLENLIKDGLGKGDLLNVNIPPIAKGKPKGLLVVPQSTAGITDDYLGAVDANGMEQYRLGGEYTFHFQDDSDVLGLAEGYITVTPLHIDMTNHDRLIALRLKKWDYPGETV